MQSRFELPKSSKIATDYRDQDPYLRELIFNMLQFNPKIRWTAKRCLESPYFDKIRVPALENAALGKVKLSYDEDTIFDYENGVSNIKNRGELFKNIVAQVYKIRKQK